MAGAQLIVVPTGHPLPAVLRGSSWNTCCRCVPSRARCSLPTPTITATTGGFGYAGQSCIVGPNGQVLAVAAETGDALLLVDIDEAVLAQGTCG